MAFFRIKEAAEKIGVVPHVLRFWESQFPTLKPNKTSRGQRLYSDEDLENFLKIKHLLYNEGYSIPGARKFLKESKSGKSLDNPANNAVEQSLREDFCKDLLDELKSLKEVIKEY